MRGLWSVFAALLIAQAVSCVGADAARDSGPVPIAALDPLLVIGMDELDSLTSFTRVQDAAFVGDGVAVLDISPPFLRVFDQSGDLVRSLVREGKGPGEAKRPSGITPYQSGYLIAEIGRVSQIDSSGKFLASLALPGQRVRGVVVACDNEILALTTPLTEVDGPGAFLRYLPGVEKPDTLLALDSVRANSRHVHPLFAAPVSGSVHIYPEDVNRRRLLKYECDGAALSEMQIDSVGRQEWWEVSESGGYLLHPSEAPWPAGVAELEGVLVWAVQDLRSVGSAEDSITRFSSYTSKGVKAVVEIRGWYQILDVSASGRVLLGSEFPVGHVIVVEAASLKKAMRSQKVRG